MNAPIRTIQIDDATKRKADLWDELQEGELGAHEHDALSRMASLGAQTAINAALLLEGMGRWYGRLKTDDAQRKSATLINAAWILRTEAGRGQDVCRKLEDQGNVYIHPEG